MTISIATRAPDLKLKTHRLHWAETQFKEGFKSRHFCVVGVRLETEISIEIASLYQLT